MAIFRTIVDCCFWKQRRTLKMELFEGVIFFLKVFSSVKFVKFVRTVILWNTFGRLLLKTEAYSKPCQTSKMGLFVKIVNNWKSWTIFIKNCILMFRSSRPEEFCKKGVLRNFAKFTGKHLCESLFDKVTGLRPATLLKKRLWHIYYSYRISLVAASECLTKS